MITSVPRPMSGHDLSQAETDRALALLAESGERVIQAVDGLGDAQWTFASGAGRWSIAEIVEHLAAMEDLFCSVIAPRLRAIPPVDLARDAAQADAQIIAWGSDPTAKVVIPGRASLGVALPQLAPTRLWAPHEFLKRFLDGRARVAAYLRSTPADVRRHLIEHPALGPMDGYQWVLFIAAHRARHTKQILGVRGDPGFPR